MINNWKQYYSIGMCIPSCVFIFTFMIQKTCSCFSLCSFKPKYQCTFIFLTQVSAIFANTACSVGFCSPSIFVFISLSFRYWLYPRRRPGKTDGSPRSWHSHRDVQRWGHWPRRTGRHHKCTKDAAHGKDCVELCVRFEEAIWFYG